MTYTSILRGDLVWSTCHIIAGLGSLLLVVIVNMTPVSGIGCFVCSSINGSEPDCEDTFNNTGRFYRDECFSGRKDRSGVFPGTECIKLKARHDSSGYRVLVRDCTVDSGDINSESELGRESHCWMVNKVIFQDLKMDGCSLACSTDGCNTANNDVTSHSAYIIILCAVSIVWPSLLGI